VSPNTDPYALRSSGVISAAKVLTVNLTEYRGGSNAEVVVGADATLVLVVGRADVVLVVSRADVVLVVTGLGVVGAGVVLVVLVVAGAGVVLVVLVVAGADVVLDVLATGRAVVVVVSAAVVVVVVVIVVVGGGGFTSESTQVSLYFQNWLSHLQSHCVLFVVSSKKACVSFGKFTPAAQRMQLSAVLKVEKRYMGHPTHVPVVRSK